jgi:hypothetical protein
MFRDMDYRLSVPFYNVRGQSPLTIPEEVLKGFNLVSGYGRFCNKHFLRPSKTPIKEGGGKGGIPPYICVYKKI